MVFLHHCHWKQKTNFDNDSENSALIIVSAKADLSFPNVSIGNPVMCYSEHRFRLKACRNDIVLAETMTKAENSIQFVGSKKTTN